MARANQHHHTVPASYLRGFSTLHGRGRFVEVLDLEKGRWRKQRPEQVCRQRGFYAIEATGWDESFVETAVFARLESDFAPTLTRVVRELENISRQKAPKRLRLARADMELLLALVALTSVRSSPMRAGLDRLTDALARAYGRRRFPDQAVFEQIRAKMPKDQVGNLSFEEFTRIIDGTGAQFTTEQTYYVGVMLGAFNRIVDALRDKNLSFAVAPRAAGLLVTSDAPVSVTMRGPSSRLEPFRVDIRDPAAIVTMPLSPRVVLWLDASMKPTVGEMSVREVAEANSRAAIPGRSVVIAATRAFRWWDGEGAREAEDLPVIAAREQAHALEIESRAVAGRIEEVLAALR